MRDVPLALPFAVLVASCSYDWSVVSSAADGGDAAFTGDVSVDGKGPADAPTDASVDVSGDASAADAPDASLPQCTLTDETNIQKARAAALDCTGVTPMPCQVLLNDECGCPVYAATNNSAEGQYATAIKTLLMTCIPSWCPTSCGPVPTKGLCIVSDGGSGALACVD